MFHWQTSKLPRCIMGSKRTRVHIGIERWKCLLCELWSKEAEEKSNVKKQKNSSTLLRQKTKYIKVLLQKVFECTSKSHPASLIVASPGISHVVEDSRPVGEQHHLPSLWSLLDYFLLHFWTHFVVKPLNKLFSVTETCCGFSVSSCWFFSLLLWIITRKKTYFGVTLLCDSVPSLHS